MPPRAGPRRPGPTRPLICGGAKESTDEHAWWCGEAPPPPGLMRSPYTLLAGMTDARPRSPRCPLVTNRQGRPAEAPWRRCAPATNRLPATSAARLSACSLVPGRRLQPGPRPPLAVHRPCARTSRARNATRSLRPSPHPRSRSSHGVRRMTSCLYPSHLHCGG